MAHESEIVQTPESLADLPLAWLSVLITDHLDGQGRLMLFQTCKAMSKAVLQHEGAQLTLSTAFKKQTAKQRKQAQAIAADASQLSIKLQGQLFPLEPCIWESVTSLDLRKVTLPADWSRGLYNLPHLDILSLKTCRFPPPPAFSRAGWRPLPSLRKLTLSDCTPDDLVPEHCQPFLDKSQTLAQLVSDDRSAIILIPGLPALTALQCTSSEALHDGELATMTLHETLEHLVLNKIRVIGNYAPDSTPRWKTLQLQEGATDFLVAALPLAVLDRFTLVGSIQLSSREHLALLVQRDKCQGSKLCLENPNAATDNLAKCKQVVFKGSKKNGWQAPYKPTEPCFHVYQWHNRGPPNNDRPIHPQLSQMLAMPAQHTQGVLALHALTLSTPLLPLITTLNPAIHTLCLCTCKAPGAFWAKLLCSLPATIRHLCIADTVLDSRDIMDMLCGSEVPDTLEQITLSEAGAEQYRRPMCALRRRRVEEAAAEYLPNVKLRWQQEYFFPTG